MKAKTAKHSSINDSTRCRHLIANGRCRMPAVDSANNLCFDHARKALQARQDSDFVNLLDAVSTNVSPDNPSVVMADNVDFFPDADIQPTVPATCSRASLDPSREAPAQSHKAPSIAPGENPLPATTEEFATQILTHKSN
jgi:hypothetical protein